MRLTKEIEYGWWRIMTRMKIVDLIEWLGRQGNDMNKEIWLRHQAIVWMKMRCMKVMTLMERRSDMELMWTTWLRGPKPRLVFVVFEIFDLFFYFWTFMIFYDFYVLWCFWVFSNLRCKIKQGNIYKASVFQTLKNVKHTNNPIRFQLRCTRIN